mmetsp:Transcript_118543/g.382687  ORF Transcript_118543/g.382687 Transcript_118543/m.382687 type:complete len:505 (-) Transcript_118543:96-1610(-)
MGAPDPDPEPQHERRQKHTVNDLIEAIGMSGHHRDVIFLNWWVHVVCGWIATAAVFLLDSAGSKRSRWTQLTSPSDRLTTIDKSLLLLVSGFSVMLGSALLGSLGDVKGRVGAITCGGVLCSCAMLIAALAPNKWVLVLGCLCGAFPRDGMAVLSQSLIAEWAPTKWRGLLCVTCHATWNVGRIGITFVWEFLPPSEHWRAFFAVACAFPLVVTAFLCARGWRYESPRWLAVHGDGQACLANLDLAAKSAAVDGGDLPPGWEDPASLQVASQEGSAVSADRRSESQQLSELMGRGVLWIIFLLSVYHACVLYSSMMLFVWSIAYLKAAGAEAAVVPAMEAAPVAKIISNLGLIVGGPGACILDTCRRTVLMKVAFLGYAVCLVLLLLSTQTVCITMAMFASMVFEEVIFTVGGVYVTEALPTTVRNSAVGIVWMFGNVGALLASSLGGQLLEVWVRLPAVSATGFLLLGFLTCCFLPPDRAGQCLHDTASKGPGYKCIAEGQAQ